jgi:hypothetical protein
MIPNQTNTLPVNSSGQGNLLDLCIPSRKMAVSLPISKNTTPNNDKDDVDLLDDLIDLFQQPFDATTALEDNLTQDIQTATENHNSSDSTQTSEDDDYLLNSKIPAKASAATTNIAHSLEATPIQERKSYRDDFHPNLKKPFKIPYHSALQTVTIITPQHKTKNTYQNDTPEENVKISHKDHNNTETETKTSHQEDITPTISLRTASFYASPFIDQSSKPRNENIDLTPELEPLRPLVLSQHAVSPNQLKISVKQI